MEHKFLTTHLCPPYSWLMTPSGSVSLPGPLFVYGAYGKTGTMIAKPAGEPGHDVVLSGGDRDRLNRLSTSMVCPASRCASMSRPPSANLSGLQLVSGYGQ